MKGIPDYFFRDDAQMIRKAIQEFVDYYTRQYYDNGNDSFCENITPIFNNCGFVPNVLCLLCNVQFSFHY